MYRTWFTTIDPILSVSGILLNLTLPKNDPQFLHS